MNHDYLQYNSIEGKTYSLFGKSDSTSGYYNTIRKLADKVIKSYPDLQRVIDDLRRFSSGKRALEKSLHKMSPDSPEDLILRVIDPALSRYTEKVDEHLESLPLLKFWDRRLATSRIQYHLYMLEIELSNRLFINDFIKADRKIALMPYCLQDFSTDCKSAKNGFDYQCRSCSRGCFQNYASQILKDHGIEPYIWMDGDMKKLAKYTLTEKLTFGVLGIACIPELTMGMRNCRKNNITVVGLPLNANRCIRWFGRFYQNSIDLDELGRLLDG